MRAGHDYHCSRPSAQLHYLRTSALICGPRPAKGEFERTRRTPPAYGPDIYKLKDNKNKNKNKNKKLKWRFFTSRCAHVNCAIMRCYILILLGISRRTRWWCLKCVIVYPARDIRPFVMYCVNGKPRSSLLIESTDSMIYLCEM